MTMTSWGGEKRLGTRDRIIRLLLKRQHTIEEMARKLNMTENAVRAQIALLQREGITEIQGEMKGSRRPAALYGIRPGAEVSQSRAYPVVLSHLVKALANKFDQKDFENILRDLGQDIAASVPRPAGDARERVAGAVRFLKSLGSLAEVTEEDGKIVIKGYGCPIAEAVTADARSCIAMESLLHELTGLPVAERCDRSGRPSCRFEIEAGPGK